VDIRTVVTAEDRESVFRLRHEVLVEELGWTIAGADTESRTVREVLDETAVLGAAFEGDRAIAALRINICGGEATQALEDLYAIDRSDPAYPNRSCLFSKLLVHGDHRRSLAVPRLLLWACGHALKTGLSRAYLDCSLDLIPFYEKIGFVSYTEDVETAEYGVIAPMRIDMADLDYLERINSPLRRVFQHHDPEHVEAYLDSLTGEGEPAFGPPPTGPAATRVFDGLSEAQMAKVFRAASLRDYADGEAIFVEGAPSWEFGVILKGRAAVAQTIEGRERIVALYSRGRTVGEMGFLRGAVRSATVTALGPCRLAMFPSLVVDNLLGKDADVAVHLFRNLAVILAERLAHAHDPLTQGP
jgi:CRP-like cAMP-binding protein